MSYSFRLECVVTALIQQIIYWNIKLLYYAPFNDNEHLVSNQIYVFLILQHYKSHTSQNTAELRLIHSEFYMALMYIHHVNTRTAKLNHI